MSTLLQVFNRTLHRVGIHNNLITDSDDNPRADVLNDFWDAVRIEFLEMHSWAWARGSLCPAVLTSPQPDPIPLGYLYQFDYPPLSIMMRHINKPEDKIVYEEFTNGTDRFLLSDYADPAEQRVEFVYTLDISDVTKWPEQPISAVVFLLALHTETDLAEGEKFAARNARAFNSAMGIAVQQSRIMEHQARKRSTTYTDARKGVGV